MYYKAPEIEADDTIHTKMGDIFSLGVTLFQLAFGKPHERLGDNYKEKLGKLDDDRIFSSKSTTLCTFIAGCCRE